MGNCYILHTYTSRRFLLVNDSRFLRQQYKSGTKQTVNLLLNIIKAAIQKEGVTPELQLHSDQGLQYTSHGYFNLIKEHGITTLMSRRRNCYDNAMAENIL